jgi:glycosyltransferase involved in cell wall biosynthesis
VRALLITDWMSGAGGAEAYFTWIRDALRASGDQVRLLTSTAGSAGDGSAEYQAFGTERMAAQAFLQIVNPFAIVQVRAALRGFHPDVVLVNMFEHHLSPAVLSQLREVPTVLTLMDYKCICPIGSKLLPNGHLCTEKAGAICWRYGCVSLPHWLRDRPRYALIRSGVRHVNRVLACSRWVQRELAGNGIEAEYLPLPVPEPGKDFRREPAPSPLFVYCGRLDREKGLVLLLHAFARVRAEVPAAQLRIVGRGPQRPILDHLVDTLGLHGAVTFRGWIAPNMVERELVDAWALVAPSLWAEPLGLVALEAIVRGVPVIASASGGFGETIEPGAGGLLFQNGNEGELIERLKAVATGNAFPSHAVPGEVVRRARESHNMGRHVDRLRSVLAEVAAVAAGPS